MLHQAHEEPGSDDVRGRGGITRTEALVAIFLVSAAGLLLEVAYTRVISYKLWYYYTYLVIGLALLGIGTGATAVVVSARLRRAPTRSLLGWASSVGALSVVAGYLVVAIVPIDTIALWDYGSRAAATNLLALVAICLALFATFLAVGVIVATLLGRDAEGIPRLYFADLLGAALGCGIVVWLISRFGPPRVIVLAAVLLSLVTAGLWWRRGTLWRTSSTTLVVVLVGLFVTVDAVLVPIRPEEAKAHPPEGGFEHSGWGPVFRVEVGPVVNHTDQKWLIHDGTYGSAIHRFDGDATSLSRFDADPRSWPFAVLGEPPQGSLIIGSAGGNEILASLYHGSSEIEAVELNPVTVDIVEGEYADYTGRLTSFPQVTLLQGDGRSHLARSDRSYELIWFVAPDSYAANNAASSGAFVLSESYLYTEEMIRESLEHLDHRGVAVAQFGEVDYEARPNRTARYVVTARTALEAMGVEDPGRHILVARSTDPLSGGLSTIMLKATPFTPEEVARFGAAIPSSPGSELVYAAGTAAPGDLVARLAAAGAAERREILRTYPFDVGAVTDDAPFFWHFSPFDEVAGDMLHSASVVDREVAIGERVLLLLLGIATAFAALFLLAPFVLVRREWRELPGKSVSAVYFAALGLGFMFYEITMIQKLTEYLGYPTYSLTVTLASILVFTGLGALWSGQLAGEAARVVTVLLAVLGGLTLAYRLLLPALTSATLEAPFALRALVAFAVLAPLGLCLGMFMPFGLSAVSRLGNHPDEYVAWSWAINGAFSVIGSVLTTILSMSWGFHTVQLLAFGAYLVAGAAFIALGRVRPQGAEIDLRSPSAAAAPARPGHPR